jgi:hypothetical protein
MTTYGHLIQEMIIYNSLVRRALTFDHICYILLQKRPPQLLPSLTGLVPCVLCRALMPGKFSAEIIDISNHSKRTIPADKLSTADQRSTPRLHLSYDVFLCRPGEKSGIITKTENVNSKGFYCISTQAFFPFEKLHCQMLIPGGPSSSPANDLVLQAVVQVIRVMPWGVGNGFGLACRLNSYTITPRSSDFPQRFDLY